MVIPPGDTEIFNKALTKDGVSRFDFYRSCLVKTLWFLIAITVFLASLRYVCLPLITHFYPEATSYFLDTGIYGPYPRQGYVSSSLIAPQANVLLQDEACAGGMVLLDLGGQSVPEDGSMIVDMSGNLIWSAPGQYGPATANAKIQRYNDEDFLTFWAGDKLQESGLGSYYMLNSSYDLVWTVSAIGEGLEGDLHEFKITEDGSAIITVYERIKADLQNMDMEHSSGRIIVDGIFQDIDIATGQLLFEWRASEHLDHPALQSTDGGLVADGSLDYFHINSIDKDSQGNYLVSLRHLHTLVCVEHGSGNILWTFGGEAGDFDDLSLGEASGFRWQHDARWISEDEGIISLFDNGNSHHHQDSPYSQGLIIQLDFVQSTAVLLQEYTSQEPIKSPSQGNVQTLTQPEGEDHVFIGWGASAAFTEHALNGDLLCETHFGASWLFYFERVKSYRAFKTFDWKAIPAAWDPTARSKGAEIYVSWNGATEVAYWSLQKRREVPNEELVDGEAFEDVDTIAKGANFETSFKLPSGDGAGIYRIAALDAEQNVLRFSNEVKYDHASIDIWIWLAMFALASGFTICGAFYVRRKNIAYIWPGRKDAMDRTEYHALQQREII